MLSTKGQIATTLSKMIYGKKLKKLITYATRGMEPMRGFPEFINGTIEFMRQYRKDFSVEIAGQDKVFYGQQGKYLIGKEQ